MTNDFDKEAASIAALAEQTRTTMGHADEDRASRLYIMKYVIALYVIVVSTIMLVNFAAAIYSGNWESTLSNVQDVGSTLVLPVVTLVLGYYFGRESRKLDK